MKRVLCLVTVALLAMLLLTGCGKFTCDMCGEEKSGGKNTEEVLGKKVVICDDCMEGLEDLADGLGDLNLDEF